MPIYQVNLIPKGVKYACSQKNSSKLKSSQMTNPMNSAGFATELG